jgi:hypothetical protein
MFFFVILEFELTQSAWEIALEELNRPFLMPKD